MAEPQRPERPWALTGAKDRPKNVITSLFLGAAKLEQINLQLQALYREIEANEVRYAEYLLDDADIVIVAYGTAGRIVQTAVKRAREMGIKAGLFRPVTVYPFPYDRLRDIAEGARQVLVVEMSAGQMLEDVRLATRDAVPIRFFGKPGGVVPLPEDVLQEIKAVANQAAT